MREILTRRSAVERIARRFGYSESEAEDFAQEAALRLIENPKLVSQRAYQTFVDVLRTRGFGTYSRSGRITQPLYESAFEDYPNFINGIGCGNDFESQQIARSDLLDALDCLEVLKPNWRVALEMYAEGFSLDEISKRLGFTESRASQLVKFSRFALKKEIVSQGISHQEQRARKWRKSQTIPRKVQTRSRVEIEISFTMASFRIQAVSGMVSFKVPKIPQGLCISF